MEDYLRCEFPACLGPGRISAVLSPEKTLAVLYLVDKAFYGSKKGGTFRVRISEDSTP